MNTLLTHAPLLLNVFLSHISKQSAFINIPNEETCQHARTKTCPCPYAMVTMVTMGSDLQPGCLADRLADWCRPATNKSISSERKWLQWLQWGGNLQPGSLADQLADWCRPATNKSISSERKWLQWSQWGVTFSQVVWLIGC